MRFKFSSNEIQGGTIQMFGADSYDNLRGQRFDGIVVDEIAMMPPDIWTVLRPALSDRKGWLIAIGTPAGHNAFFDLYDNALNNPDEWYTAVFKASETKIIDEDELRAARKMMSEEQYEQEFEVRARFSGIRSGGGKRVC